MPGMISPRRNGGSQLEEYMAKMKGIKSGGQYLDTRNFNQSSEALEQEVINLKHLYESEISRLRAEIGKTLSSYFRCQQQNKSLLKSTDELIQRVDSQVETNTELEDGLTNLQATFKTKEEEVSILKLRLQQESTDAAKRPTSANQLSKALKDNAELKQRLEAEVARNRTAQDRLRELQHQTEFNDQVSVQQQHDLQGRLSASSGAILSLEGRVRQLDRYNEDEHVELMLSKIKETSQRELFKYKQETETAFDRDLTMLKAQVESDRNVYESVTTENRRLKACVEELNTKIRNLQGELMHLEHGKCAAEENLVLERDCSNKQIEALETRLAESQENVMDKMKELNLVKSENLPLKTESASLKALINEEKDRMCLDMKGQTEYARHSHILPASHLTHSYSPATQDHVAIAPRPGVPVASPSVVPGTSLESGYEAVRAPIRPIFNRIQSAPVKKFSEIRSQRRGSTEELGQGRSYFHEMFKQNRRAVQTKSAGTPRQHVHFDRLSSAKSSLGALTIHEIGLNGKYIMLHNSSPTTDLEIGGYTIQQNVCGVPVTHYTFPPRLTFKSGDFVTVFAGVCSSTLYEPPTQFVNADDQRWGTGPECTTVLCNAAGKAVAWVNASQHHGMAVRDDSSSTTFSSIQPASKVPTQCQAYKSQRKQSEDSESHSMGLKRLRSCIENHRLQSTNHLPRIRQSQDLVNQKPADGDSVFMAEIRTSRPNTATTLCKSPVSRPSHSASGQRMGSAPMRRFAPSSRS